LLFGIVTFITGAIIALNDVFGFLERVGGAALFWIYQKAQDVFDAFYSLGGALSDFTDIVVEKFNAVKDWIGGLPAWFWQAGVDIWNGFIDGLAQASSGIFHAFIDPINTAIQAFKHFLGISSPSTLFYGFGWDVITGFINGIRDFAVDIFKPIFDAVTTAINWLAGLPLQFWNLGKSIAQGLVDGILSVGSIIKDTVVGVATSAWQGVKDFFHIGSPSKLMMDLGVQVGKGFELGLSSTSVRVAAAATGALAKPVVAAAQARVGAASGLTIQNQTVNLPAAPGHDQMGDPRHQAAQFAREMRRRGRG
jgi:hypothetical protein